MADSSAALDNQKTVAILVAEEEHRRHRVAHPHDLLVDVYSARAQVGMIGVDVIGGEGDTGGDPHLFSLLREHKRQRCLPSLGSYFHPAVSLAEGDVCALLQTELADIEVKRAVLVADWNHHRPDLGDVGLRRSLAHRVLLGCGLTHRTVPRLKTHRGSHQEHWFKREQVSASAIAQRGRDRSGPDAGAPRSAPAGPVHLALSSYAVFGSPSTASPWMTLRQMAKNTSGQKG